MRPLCFRWRIGEAINRSSAPLLSDDTPIDVIGLGVLAGATSARSQQRFDASIDAPPCGIGPDETVMWIVRLFQSNRCSDRELSFRVPIKKQACSIHKSNFFRLSSCVAPFFLGSAAAIRCDLLVSA